MNEFVREAISNTKEFFPDYWRNTVAQRSIKNGAGSVYNATPEEIETAVYNADWVETSHPKVLPGCRVFKANIGLEGYFGLVPVSPEKVYVIEGRKNTGNISLTVKGERGALTTETYLIVGEEEGKMIVFTFHPGEPISPSSMKIGETFNHGDVISGETAIALGFSLAKVTA